MELLVVVGILGVLMSVALTTFRDLNNDARSSAQQINSALTRARMKAMSSTAAVRVNITGNNLVVDTAKQCTESAATSWTTLPDYRVTLPPRTTVTLAANSPAICFTSRGYAQAQATVNVVDVRNRSASVVVYLGGATKVLP